MKTHDISSRFTDFFVKNGHTLVPSASLIMPDPNLLFVNAGMVPFVPYFLGQKTPDFSRATSIQKCVRTLDIEEVGITTRHNTFFQMAGNFSFGDYFKKEVIPFAWTLLTSPISEGGFGIDPEKLWVTVYKDDQEALDIWHKDIGLPLERIQKMGMEDNYWSMNIPGPCGPSSEIYFDKGPEYGKEGGPAVDDNRYMEIWNLVFMEKIRGEGIGKGNFEIVGDLPKKNIDTGLGLERLASLLQGVDNVYETDLLAPVIALTGEITGKKYGANHEDDVRFRIIADHSRTSAMLMSDSIIPGNDGRGYVLRRLLRRIIRSNRLLGNEDRTIEQYVGTALDAMANIYPELTDQKQHILQIAGNEEDVFLKTIDSGTKIFLGEMQDLKKNNQTQLSGESAFELHDTYGFPIDLTLEMATENGLDVDRAGFDKLMQEQRKRAKDDSNAKKQAHKDISIFKEFVDNHPTEFLGYDTLETPARVLGIFKDSQPVNELQPGEQGTVILDKTSLYAEAGGQLSDRGRLIGAGMEAEVVSIQKVLNRLWLHTVKVLDGKLTVNQDVVTEVDKTWRWGADKGHSGTHLVHGAIRQILGPNAIQAGSMNKPGYLRFDFQYPGKISAAQEAEIENVANQVMLGNYAVNTTVTDLNTAKQKGALALFGEKYEDNVRMVEIDGKFSLELCGGTHVNSSAEVGQISVFSLSSIGTGVKRIEAFVGTDSQDFLQKERSLLSASSELLNVKPAKLPERIDLLLANLKAKDTEIKVLKQNALQGKLNPTLANKVEAEGITKLATILDPNSDNADFKYFSGLVFQKITNPAVLLLLTVVDKQKVNFAIMLNKAAITAGKSAKDYLPAVSQALQGQGGGSDMQAQGSGTKVASVDNLVSSFLN